jgi:hypothetical protein
MGDPLEIHLLGSHGQAPYRTVPSENLLANQSSQKLYKNRGVAAPSYMLKISTKHLLVVHYVGKDFTILLVELSAG